ncbi:rhomboid family membrane [Trichoderma arundinaceum]|uniref:Rhomboid family membrane n=1 Tax=Trichoderma arundinaceum TaxID=490622 RepID=A0A395P144_TRIAR|nr:rhomboid family membrane [Trichoderma arundinaceum]
MSEQPEKPPLPPRNEFIHNSALAGAIIAPLAMLLPPRKADIRLLVLVGTFSLCTNQLAYEYTGQSIYGRFGNRVGSIFDTGLPEGAKRTQQLLKEQREREAAQRHKQKSSEEGESNKGVLKDIWMGGEGENWREKRAEEHKKSFQEGKGMSDIIFDQIADVWSGNWRGKAKSDDSASDDSQGEKKK